MKNKYSSAAVLVIIALVACTSVSFSNNVPVCHLEPTTSSGMPTIAEIAAQRTVLATAVTEPTITATQKSIIPVGASLIEEFVYPNQGESFCYGDVILKSAPTLEDGQLIADTISGRLVIEEPVREGNEQFVTFTYTSLFEKMRTGSIKSTYGVLFNINLPEATDFSNDKGSRCVLLYSPVDHLFIAGVGVMPNIIVDVDIDSTGMYLRGFSLKHDGSLPDFKDPKWCGNEALGNYVTIKGIYIPLMVAPNCPVIELVSQ